MFADAAPRNRLGQFHREFGVDEVLIVAKVDVVRRERADFLRHLIGTARTMLAAA